MNRIMSLLKAFFESLRERKSRLTVALRGYIHQAGMWIPAGLIIAGCTIGIAVYATTRDMDKNMDLRSPQYEVQAAPEEFMPEEKPVHTAEEGVVVIPAVAAEAPVPLSNTQFADNTDAIWEADKVVTYNSFTTQSQVKQEDGSLGVLTIPSLSLSVNVFQSESEMESMTKGVAHFGYTSVWDGNVGLCAHNVNMDLSDGYFKNIHQLKKGDEVRFSTELGERVYAVTLVKEIADTDWTGLGRTPDNRISMITCITGKPDKRLLVQCVENRSQS